MGLKERWAESKGERMGRRVGGWEIGQEVRGIYYHDMLIQVVQCYIVLTCNES